MDSDSDLTADLRAFLYSCIDSVDHVNRLIRLRQSPAGTTLDTCVLGSRVRLPANWRGQRPGAAQCAMHGLLFDAPMRVANADRTTWSRRSTPATSTATGRRGRSS